MRRPATSRHWPSTCRHSRPRWPATPTTSPPFLPAPAAWTRTLRRVMETLAAWHADFRAMIADWDHVMATLASREQNLQGTIVEQDRVMGILDQALSGGAAEGLHGGIAQAPEMVDNANHYLNGAATVMGVVQQDTPAIKQLFIELASVMSGVGTAQENGPDKGNTVHMWRVYCATHCFEPSD